MNANAVFDRIETVDYAHFRAAAGAPAMTVCRIVLRGGWAVIGTSMSARGAFDEAIGQRLAFDKATGKAMLLETYRAVAGRPAWPQGSPTAPAASDEVQP